MSETSGQGFGATENPADEMHAKNADPSDIIGSSNNFTEESKDPTVEKCDNVAPENENSSTTAGTGNVITFGGSPFGSGLWHRTGRFAEIGENEREKEVWPPPDFENSGVLNRSFNKVHLKRQYIHW